MNRTGLRDGAIAGGVLGLGAHLLKRPGWVVPAAILGAIGGYAFGHAREYPQGSW